MFQLDPIYDRSVSFYRAGNTKRAEESGAHRVDDRCGVIHGFKFEPDVNTLQSKGLHAAIMVLASIRGVNMDYVDTNRIYLPLIGID